MSDYSREQAITHDATGELHKALADEIVTGEQEPCSVCGEYTCANCGACHNPDCAMHVLPGSPCYAGCTNLTLRELQAQAATTNYRVQRKDGEYRVAPRMHWVAENRAARGLERVDRCDHHALLAEVEEHAYYTTDIYDALDTLGLLAAQEVK